MSLSVKLPEIRFNLKKTQLDSFEKLTEIGIVFSEERKPGAYGDLSMRWT